MLHPSFDFKPFKSVRVNSYSLLTNGDFPFITVVEGMVVVEFGEKFAAPDVLKETIFKVINYLVPIWQPRLYASDQRMQQADVCATIVNKIGAPTVTAASVVITPYQDDDCPTRTEVLIKLVKQADGIHRLTVITL